MFLTGPIFFSAHLVQFCAITKIPLDLNIINNNNTDCNRHPYLQDPDMTGILSGRFQSNDSASDIVGIVINETALRQFNIGDPLPEHPAGAGRLPRSDEQDRKRLE